MTATMIRTFFRNKLTLIATFMVVGFLALAVFAPSVSPFPPGEIDPLRRLQGPSWVHPFGTDHIGRDIFSRVIHGTRTSIAVSVMVVVVSSILGSIAGIAAGYYPRVDNVIMRVMDGFMAFPGILLAIALMASLGPNPSNIVIALTIVYTPRVSRIARATVLVLRRQVFVEAAQALGSSDVRIIARHIAPNCIGPVNVQITFIFAYAILAEAALSFLGVGAPPDIPTWGNILSEGRPYIQVAPWITIFPGLTIMLAVLALNVLGDGLRDVLDPRLKGVV